MADEAIPETLDVLIVGAGAAGLYLLHRLRSAGFHVKCVEAAGGVGGTWYWNRYPGARCDVESMRYSFGFDEDLQQEWAWTERYAAQPEILRYLNHVADRFDLRRDITFDTRVTAAHFDEQTARWNIETDKGSSISTTYCVMATGCLSAAKEPRIDGLQSFAGDLYWTARWPHEPVDFSGRRVGVIGTGSTGIQVIPVIAEQAEHLFVFQRTAQYAVPARNRPLDPDEVREIKAEYASLRALLKSTATGDVFSARDVSALEVPEEERNREFEARWREGGIGFMASFRDLVANIDANRAAQEFVKAKIRAAVEDPEVAELLCPDDIFGGRRLCLDSGYFETFNRPNVTLVDVSKTPITAVTPEGVDVAGKLYAIDALVLATGFDAMTGALNRIDIRGRDGKPLKDKWAAGPRTYLGLAVAGFPNLFVVTGPGSPSVLSNMMTSIEQHVEWIADCLEHLRSIGARQIEADASAEDAWVSHVNEVAGQSLRPSVDSWYVGANIPGKPRVFMPYLGGAQVYRRKCDDVAAAGYAGFTVA